jgi:hypothetical protein
MGVALMKKDRLGGRRRQLQLRDESRALRRGRGEIAKVIEAAFADGDDFGTQQQFAQLLAAARVEARGVMRMHAGGAPQRRIGGGE